MGAFRKTSVSQMSKSSKEAKKRGKSSSQKCSKQSALNEDLLHTPSTAVAFLIYCVLPLAFFAIAGIYGDLRDRWNGHGTAAAAGGGGERQEPTLMNANQARRRSQNHGGDSNSIVIDTSNMPQTDEVANVQEMLAKRGIKISAGNQQNSDSPKSDTRATSTPKSAKDRVDEYIAGLRAEHAADPQNIYKALNLAESLRQRDLSFHDGGTAHMEAISTYKAAIDLILEKRTDLIENARPTNIPLSGETQSMNEELFLETTSKSIDGLLCATYCSLAKILFMANMFEQAVSYYDEALKLAPDYLDALTYRASTLIILGRYEEAAQNYLKVLELDKQRLFVDVYTGLGKILVAKEESVEGGWSKIVDIVEAELPQKEAQLSGLKFPADGIDKNSVHMQQQIENTKSLLVDTLKRMHHFLFSYHDAKTKDAERAWHHLSSAYRHKMSVLPPWNGQHEMQRVAMVKQVFNEGFWPEGVGSNSPVPIFIIGFVRSGSTLLERILDAHTQIVGTGEDSVFNGQLDYIRNKIVEASMTQNPVTIRDTVQDLADGVVRDMRTKWEALEAANPTNKDPKRFADKMLTNYMNVGFIHMLFPKALILHVAREPMDSVFSAYKHDFPPGTLDYTSEFPGLAQLYLGYRDIMEHWDNVLPGRVTHIRYEDMVEDLSGVAKALIDATGLPWEEDVLQFHKKKQAVNTLSTTQVRKGIYKDHLKSWMRYEDQLQPLVTLLGDKVQHDYKTTLPGYRPQLEK